MKKFFLDFLDEFKGFLYVIGLRNNAQRLLVGLALTIGLLMACGMGEAISILK